MIFSVVIYTLGLGCNTTIGLNIGTGRLLFFIVCNSSCHKKTKARKSQVVSN